MPLVEIWDRPFTPEERVRLQKAIADVFKEVRPFLREHEEFLWILFHEISPENWMVGPMTVKELRQKLTGQ